MCHRPTTLAATTAPTFEQVAAIASEVTGRTIELAVIDRDEWRAGRVAAGQQELMARFTLGMCQAAYHGFFAGVDPLLRTLLGHEPRTVHDLLAHKNPSKPG